MLRILIADDSPTARLTLKYIITLADDLRVVGEAHDGPQSVEMAAELRPDVILMDIVMPGMDGLEATREIMHHSPTPIVVVSATVEGRETEIAFQAIKAGALTVLPKPPGPTSTDFDSHATNLHNTIRAMSSVSVIHHWKSRSSTPTRQPIHSAPKTEPVSSNTYSSPLAPPEIVAIVSSTGGPAALNEILSNLPADFPVPIVIVQHIAADFLPSLVKWLNTVSNLTVTLAEPNQVPQPGHVYVAPGEGHLRFANGRRFGLDMTTAAPHTPSGDVLLDSVARQYGAKAVGVILTGMGNDGASGLRAMCDTGAYTIAQDEETSAVFGMPREAINLGATRQVLPVSAIAGTLIELVGNKEKNVI